ncbi:uncharacterized protein LOC131447633 [Solea solea]|uniref:uncharacterized protein LOC131447633 n=1 Tax=Solea solea TaxID=90069 RepID=UPI00272A8478|nr:uncharacterized protein LOC131447633 [Solea solea]
MSHSDLCLEALSALSSCHVVSTSGPSLFTPQDFVNVVALKEFYKQEGFKELEYPGLGTMSLDQDLDQDLDLYSPPPALCESPGPQESLHKTVKINFKEFFHPNYDYDFTNIRDGDREFLRGNERYVRPCGWRRVALRVVQMYDNDSWLGMGKEAWPVSYHAHNMDGSLGVILTHGGNPDHQPEFLELAAAALQQGGNTQGRGVYSTPDIKMADKYCKTFKSKVDGNTYKVVLQNRINPEKRICCQRDDVWLVYVPEGSNSVQTRVLVQDSLRPYGLLLKQL